MGEPQKGNTPGSVTMEICSVISSLNMPPDTIIDDGIGEYLSDKDSNAAHASQHALQAMDNLNRYEARIMDIVIQVRKIYVSDFDNASALKKILPLVLALQGEK